MGVSDRWKGIYVASATPFSQDGQINEEEFARLVRFHLEQGVNGSFLGGSTGEGIHLTCEEVLQLCRIAVAESRGRGKVIAHIGGRSTKQCVYLAHETAKLEVDAVGCMLPLVYPYDFLAIERHYRTVAEATDLPLLIYWLPQASSFSFTDQQLEQLFSIPNLMGIKYSGTELYQIQRLSWVSSRLTIFSGEDKMMLGGLAMGASGAIGLTVNYMPRLYVSLYHAFLDGNLARAQALQQKALRVLLLGRRDLHPISSCKTILQLIGFNIGIPRSPLRALSGKEVSGLRVRLEEIGFFEDSDYIDWKKSPSNT